MKLDPLTKEIRRAMVIGLTIGFIGGVLWSLALVMLW